MTFEVFKIMISAYKPFSFFLDFVRAFGYRNEDDTRIRSGYRWSMLKEDKYDGKTSLLT